MFDGCIRSSSTRSVRCNTSRRIRSCLFRRRIIPRRRRDSMRWRPLHDRGCRRARMTLRENVLSIFILSRSTFVVRGGREISRDRAHHDAEQERKEWASFRICFSTQLLRIKSKRANHPVSCAADRPARNHAERRLAPPQRLRFPSSESTRATALPLSPALSPSPDPARPIRSTTWRTNRIGIRLILRETSQNTEISRNSLHAPTATISSSSEPRTDHSHSPRALATPAR